MELGLLVCNVANTHGNGCISAFIVLLMFTFLFVIPLMLLFVPYPPMIVFMIGLVCMIYAAVAGYRTAC